MLKQKIGIFRGKGDDEFITFRGNLDYDNDEREYSSITVYKYWDSSVEKYCDRDYQEFENFWEGEEFEYIKNYVKVMAYKSHINIQLTSDRFRNKKSNYDI